MNHFEIVKLPRPMFKFGETPSFDEEMEKHQNGLKDSDPAQYSSTKKGMEAEFDPNNLRVKPEEDNNDKDTQLKKYVNDKDIKKQEQEYTKKNPPFDFNSPEANMVFGNFEKKNPQKSSESSGGQARITELPDESSIA